MKVASFTTVSTLAKISSALRHLSIARRTRIMQSKSRSLVVAIALGWTVVLASVALPSVALALPLSTDLIMYHDYDGDLLDNSGHSNNGTGMTWTGANFDPLNPVYQNSNTATISYGTGKIGQAAWINSDGTTPGNNNYITLGSHTSNSDFNFGDTVTVPPSGVAPKDISISMWVKGFFNPLANNDDAAFSATKARAATHGYYLRRGTGSRLTSWRTTMGIPIPRTRVDGGGIGPDVNDDAWHHMGVSLDRDGSGRRSSTAMTPAFTFSITDMALLTMNPRMATRINIGQDSTGGHGSRWTNGLLVDDMAIWTRKLNSGDFASICNAGTAMVPASLATVWAMNWRRRPAAAKPDLQLELERAPRG
jgi:hypothetical protein